MSPDQYLTSTRDWVSLAPEQPLFVDAVEFEAYLDKAEEEREQDLRLYYVGKAVGVYQGIYCDGIYSDWCLIERERLERRYLRALGILMADRIKNRLYKQAIAYGAEILSRDSLREEVHRALMYCFWKTGDSAASIRQFQICARLLQDELGIMPLPETIALQRRIVEERVSASLDRSGESGRHAQLQEAFESFQSAADALEVLMQTSEEFSRQLLS